VQSIQSQERAVLCLLVEWLCRNSISYLHKRTRLIENTEAVYGELQYNFLLLPITVSARLQYLDQELDIRQHPPRSSIQPYQRRGVLLVPGCTLLITHTHIHTHANTLTHTQSHTHTHATTHTLTRTLTLTHSREHTNANTLTHTLTYTHSHSH
jgi:hypothetical protein